MFVNICNMIWFFLGFLFGLFVAQESPEFPSIKKNCVRLGNFVKDIVVTEKAEPRRRTKSQ